MQFNVNKKMTSRNDENHNNAFKVRLVLDPFNKCFLESAPSTKQQSINVHGEIQRTQHSKQYVKGKPTKWGFKIWCRCAAKSGYLYEFDLYSGKKMNTLNMDWERVKYYH